MIQKMMQTMEDTRTNPVMRNNILTTEMEPRETQWINSKKEMQYFFKMCLKDVEKDIPAFNTMPGFKVLYSTLGKDGDKSGDLVQWNKPRKEARFTITLRRGASERVKNFMPNIIEDQDKAIGILKDFHVQLLEKAFRSENMRSDRHIKAARAKAKKENKGASAEDIDAAALKIYIDGAKNSGVREETFTEDGTEVTEDCIRVKRRIESMRNGELVSQYPVFHKMHRDGFYHSIEFKDYIPRDTIVEMGLRVQFYTTALAYGTGIWFNEDIRVLHKPGRKRKREIAAPVPYMADGSGDEEEPDAKRLDFDEGI